MMKKSTLIFLILLAYTGIINSCTVSNVRLYVGHTLTEADTGEKTTINVACTSSTFYFKVVWDATGPAGQVYQVKITASSGTIEEIETTDTHWLSSTDKLTDIYSYGVYATIKIKNTEISGSSNGCTVNTFRVKIQGTDAVSTKYDMLGQGRLGLNSVVEPDVVQVDTYLWTINQPDDNVYIETGTQTKQGITIIGKNPSSSVGDITVHLATTTTDGVVFDTQIYITAFKVEIKDTSGNPANPNIVISDSPTQTYKAIVTPTGLPCTFVWEAPQTYYEITPNGDTCSVRGKEIGYSIPLQLTCHKLSAGNDDLDMIQVNVFRPDIEIQDPVIGEDAEEETGIYIRKNATRTLTIGIKDYIMPETGRIQLTLNTASNKITLYEGTGTETLLSFPYTWDATPSAIPKTLTLKGEQTSNTDKDIILILTGQANPDNISTDTAIITVFDIDLDWEGLSEDAEEETGIYIPLNVDDDNSDTILDKNQSPVFGENDMKKLIIRRPSPSNLPGFIALTISSGSSKIKLWEDTSTDTKKVTEITYKNYNISDELQSDTYLWVEGISASSSEKDIEYKITYTAPDTTTGEDKVKATVYALNSVKLYYHSLDEFPFTDTQITIKPVAEIKSGDTYRTSNETIVDTSNWYYNFPADVIKWKDVWEDPSFNWENVTHTIVQELSIKKNPDGSGGEVGKARWYGYEWSNSSITDWGTTTTLLAGVHRYKTTMTLIGTKQTPDKEDALKIKVRDYYEDDYYGKPTVKWASACLGARYEWGGWGSDKKYAGGKESPNLGVSGGDYSGTGYVYLNGSWKKVYETGGQGGYGFDCSGLVSHAANQVGYFLGKKNCEMLCDSTVTDTIHARADLHAGDLLIKRTLTTYKPVHVRIVIETPDPNHLENGDPVRWIGAEGHPDSIVETGQTSFGVLESKGYVYKRLKQ